MNSFSPSHYYDSVQPLCCLSWVVLKRVDLCQFVLALSGGGRVVYVFSSAQDVLDISTGKGRHSSSYGKLTVFLHPLSLISLNEVHGLDPQLVQISGAALSLVELCWITPSSDQSPWLHWRTSQNQIWQGTDWLLMLSQFHHGSALKLTSLNLDGS